MLPGGGREVGGLIEYIMGQEDCCVLKYLQVIRGVTRLGRKSRNSSVLRYLKVARGIGKLSGAGY